MQILVADDHEVVRQGLRRILEAHRGWKVCGEAGTGRDAVKQAMQLKPDLVVMDFAMPELNGLEATRQIRQALPRTEVLMLTMYDSEQLMREVVAAGARGYVLKSDAGAVLANAVEHLLEHKPFFTTKGTEWLLSRYMHQTGAEEDVVGDRLTPREREVLQLVAEGKSNKEIAELLQMSVHTAETHRSNLMRKLDLRSVCELVRYAIRNRIIEP